jgi:hypothetical protein
MAQITEKSFMKSATGVNFIEPFWHNLRPQWYNPSQHLRQYANSMVNYALKVL